MRQSTCTIRRKSLGHVPGLFYTKKKGERFYTSSLFFFFTLCVTVQQYILYLVFLKNKHPKKLLNKSRKRVDLSLKRDIIRLRNQTRRN